MAENGVISNKEIITVLKITPLLFSVLLDIFSRNYDRDWRTTVNNYFESVGHDIPSDEINWKYRHLSIYLQDKLQTKTTLVLAFVYTGVMHTIEFNESPVFLLLGVIFILCGLLSFAVVDRWYKIESESRNPDTYYKYYYEKDSSGKTISREYVNSYLPSRIDRHFSPRKSSIIANFLLLFSIIGVEWASVGTAIIFSVIILILVLWVAFFTSPGHPKGKNM